MKSEMNIRQQALEFGFFVVCASSWLNPDQQAQIMQDTISPISGAAA